MKYSLKLEAKVAAGGVCATHRKRVQATFLWTNPQEVPRTNRAVPERNVTQLNSVSFILNPSSLRPLFLSRINFLLGANYLVFYVHWPSSGGRLSFPHLLLFACEMADWEAPTLTRQQHLDRFILENPGMPFPPDANDNVYEWLLGDDAVGEVNCAFYLAPFEYMLTSLASARSRRRRCHRQS